MRMEELLTVEELAKKLEMSRSWVRLRVYDGTLPVIRLGRRVRFSWPDVCRTLGIPQDQNHQDQDQN